MRSQPQKAKYHIKESKQNIHIWEIKTTIKNRLGTTKAKNANH